MDVRVLFNFYRLLFALSLHWTVLVRTGTNSWSMDGSMQDKGTQLQHYQNNFAQTQLFCFHGLCFVSLQSICENLID